MTRLILFTVLVTGCSRTDNEKFIFSDQADKESVWIVLSEYHLDSIPPDIGRLKEAKRLFISRKSGWTIYPPMSTLPQQMSRFSRIQLPDEITELSNLTCLYLAGLNLERLPEGFGKLKNLDSLYLPLNGLTILDEKDKLKQLTGLKFLDISGNVIDSTALMEIKRGNPNLHVQIMFGLDSL